MERRNIVNKSRIYTAFACILGYAILSNFFLVGKYTPQNIFVDHVIQSISSFADSDDSTGDEKERVHAQSPQDDTSTPLQSIHSSKGISSSAADSSNSTTTATTTTTNTSSATSFKRYDGVVIVTKVLNQKDANKVAIMLCFLQHSYNDKRKYDIVVFTTEPWEEEAIAKLQADLAPTKLTVAVEGPPLMEQVGAMTPTEKAFLYKRCNVTLGLDISWRNYCTEEGSNLMTSLGYSWQAEFRSYHIWNHEAIRDYKYMMWFDSDALVAREWDKDPMEVMVEKGLILLYAAFPYGRLRNNLVVDRKMRNVYNKSICIIQRTKEELTLYPYFCDSPKTMNKVPTVGQIGGFHHITSLDVYRKPIHQQFLKDFVGDYRFSRQYDDQVAVTIPAMFEQDTMEPGIPRVAEERGSFANLTLHIAHHSQFDGKRERAPKRSDSLFYKMKDSWPGLQERCGSYF